MKTTEEMTFDELMNYWSGRMIISIGEGKFRDTVAAMLLSTMHDCEHRKDKNAKAKKR